MQDQVYALNSKGIPCVLVGSAQVDKQVEMHALEPDSKELLIFVTPEWMKKPANQAKLHTLVRANQLYSYIYSVIHVLWVYLMYTDYCKVLYSCT